MAKKPSHAPTSDSPNNPAQPGYPGSELAKTELANKELAKTELAKKELAMTDPAGTQVWLSLKEASDFLGVHFTTLRTWADRGEVRVIRTPGGHRRFGVDDLRRFLDERANHAQLPAAAAQAAVADAALLRVREELARVHTADSHDWRESMRADPSNDRQQRGRKLLALALAYVMRPGQRAQILAEGKLLGMAYGRDAAMHGISLGSTGRAVQFFRTQLVETVRSRDAGGVMDADDQRVHQEIDHFLDEILFAVLDGYEAHQER